MSKDHQTAQLYLAKKRLEEEVNLYSYKGETYIKKDFHDKQKQELQNSIKFKDDYIEKLTKENQELQIKTFAWEKDYLDLQLRNQELQRQVDRHEIIYQDLALEYSYYKSQYTQIKEAADEMAEDLIKQSEFLDGYPESIEKYKSIIKQ